MNYLEIKAEFSVDETGTITGIAWPFGEGPDKAGDLIAKGAFNVPYPDMPMLFGHKTDDLVGTWHEVKETDEGLIVKGKLHMDRPRARSVLSMIKSEILKGLSIGFYTKAATKQGRNRLITALDVVETSLTGNPSHPRARVVSAKQFDSASAIAAALNRAAAHFAK
jgi:HK97 family phage prohead protease